MNFRSALNLARCCHPEPTLAVTALVTLLAIRWGRGAGSAWVGAAVLFGQLSVGWANDYIDRERDAGRTDKPLAAGLVSGRLVVAASLVALCLGVVLSLASGLAATAVHVVALALAHAYNLRLKQTILSVATYAVAFALAPAFVTLGLRGHHLPPAWVMAAAALLGAGAHFTQTLGDHDRDRAAGIRGTPQRLGRQLSVVVAGLLLGLAGMFATLGPGRPSNLALALFATSLVLVSATVLAGLGGRFKLSFRLTIGAAGAAVVSLLVGTGSGFGG